MANNSCFMFVNHGKVPCDSMLYFNNEPRRFGNNNLIYVEKTDLTNEYIRANISSCFILSEDILQQNEQYYFGASFVFVHFFICT